MSKYKKAAVGLVFLVLVWVMFFLVLAFLDFINVKDILSYKSDVNVFINVNDDGTELYTILAGETNNTKHMVIMGSTIAKNKPNGFDAHLKKAIESMAKSKEETIYYLKVWLDDNAVYTHGKGTVDSRSKVILTSNVIDTFLEAHKSPLKGIGKCIVETSELTGVHPLVILSVAIHESGWGKSGLSSNECDKRHNNEIKTSYNLFGITKGSSWSGETCKWETNECFASDPSSSIIGKCSVDCGSDKQCYRMVREFRSYLTKCDSIQDFANIISKSSRYSEAMKYSRNPEIMIREIGKAGYATDSKWIGGVTNYANQFSKEYPYALIGEEGVWADIPVPGGGKGRVQLII